MHYDLHVIVIHAAQQFYNASTYVPVKSDHPNQLKRKTQMLTSIIDPEEKRRIIGDTFMTVCTLTSIYRLLVYQLYGVVSLVAKERAQL